MLPEPADPVERARLLTLFFEAMLGIQRNTGEPVLGVVMDNKVVAAAILESGGVPVATLISNGLLQMPRMLQGIGWSGLKRGIQLQSELIKNHPHEPHIYLNFLGVDPDYQRHHCGSAIIEELRRLAAARACYAASTWKPAPSRMSRIISRAATKRSARSIRSDAGCGGCCSAGNSGLTSRLDAGDAQAVRGPSDVEADAVAFAQQLDSGRAAADLCADHRDMGKLEGNFLAAM